MAFGSPKADISHHPANRGNRVGCCGGEPEGGDARPIGKKAGGRGGENSEGAVDTAGPGDVAGIAFGEETHREGERQAHGDRGKAGEQKSGGKPQRGGRGEQGLHRGSQQRGHSQMQQHDTEEDASKCFCGLGKAAAEQTPGRHTAERSGDHEGHADHRMPPQQDKALQERDLEEHESRAQSGEGEQAKWSLPRGGHGWIHRQTVTPAAVADVIDRFFPGAMSADTGGDAASPPHVDGNVLDYPGLCERVMGDHGMARRLLDHFLEDIPKQLGALEKGLTEPDLEKARRVNHTLKGASANLNALEILAICDSLREEFKQGLHPDADTTIARFQAAWRRLEEAVQHLE